MKNGKTDLKKRKFGLYATIFAALSLAIAIVLNLLASRLDITWDMTPSGLYELTDTTKDYLQSLTKDVKFYFLMDMDTLEDDQNSMALHQCLEAYDSYEHIELIDFEPDDEPDLTAQLQESGYQLNRGDMVLECEGRTKHVAGTDMYVSNVSEDESGNQYVESSYFTGENYITGAIDAVVSGRDTVMYFLTGHGEKTLENDYTTLTQNLSNRNYRTESLDLNTVDTVPADAAILVVAAPKFDISKDETRKLNDYLDAGGNICFWMSPNDAKLSYTNIESIMNDFGIAMDYDLVREDSELQYLNSEDKHTFRVSIVRAEEENNEVDLTSGLADYVDQGIVPYMSNTRSFYALGEYEDTSLKLGSLLQTVVDQKGERYDDFGNLTSTAVGEVYGGDADDPKDIENTILDLAMYSTSSLRGDAKIMVMGNAEFIDDDTMADEQKLFLMNIPVNLTLSVFSWMYDSTLDMDMGIAEKEAAHDTLIFQSESDANATIAVFVIVPALVGLVGLFVWLRRRFS